MSTVFLVRGVCFGWWPYISLSDDEEFPFGLQEVVDFINIPGQYDQIQDIGDGTKFFQGVDDDKLVFFEPDGKIIDDKIVGMGDKADRMSFESMPRASNSSGLVKLKEFSCQ